MYDISPKLTSETAVFPGDTPLERKVLLSLDRGDAITLSSLKSTVHLGAHADGPNHYVADGRSIDEQPLEHYIGRSQVIRVQIKRGSRISVEDLPGPITEQRVLFATGTWPDPTIFNTDFCALSPELIDHLAQFGVITVGIDTPSVDTADSTSLPAHHAIARHDMAILECLDLHTIEPGVYELIALPLPLVGFDASPVRAVLRDINAVNT